MSTAKKLRMARILNGTSKRALIVPIDHGLTLGPLPGIESSRAASAWLGHQAINAVIAHKGMVARLAEQEVLRGKGVFVHLNGMPTLASHSDNKAMLTSVEAAARLGADGVSLQVNFTGDNDRENWLMLGQVADEAEALGLVVLTMLYDKVTVKNREGGTERMKRLLRSAVELGTDAIKIGLPEERFDLGEVLADVAEDAMIFVAGGQVTPTDQFLTQVVQSLRAGARGVCVGRNVFARPKPEIILGQLGDILAEGGAKLRVMEAGNHGVH